MLIIIEKRILLKISVDAEVFKISEGYKTTSKNCASIF